MTAASRLDPVEQGAARLYREARHADVFMRLIGFRHGFAKFYLAGVCSGATLAFLSAVKDRASTVVLGNIQFYQFAKRSAIEAV